jgi:hypothetical protein
MLVSIYNFDMRFQIYRPDYGDSMHLRNVGLLQRDSIRYIPEGCHFYNCDGLISISVHIDWVLFTFDKLKLRRSIALCTEGNHCASSCFQKPVSSETQASVINNLISSCLLLGKIENCDVIRKASGDCLELTGITRQTLIWRGKLANFFGSVTRKFRGWNLVSNAFNFFPPTRIYFLEYIFMI